MSNNKQSSIEFLTMQLIKNGIITNDDLRQAKAMHKEESIDTYIDGMFKGQELYLSEHKKTLDINTINYCVKVGEQYYNEKFNYAKK